MLVDPLIPTEDAERRRFLDALDRDVERRGRQVAILVTCVWHARSSRSSRNDTAGGWSTRASSCLPAGVVVVPAPAAEEVVYWLARRGRSSPATSCSGRRGSPCPRIVARLRRRSRAARSDLAPLLDLPVERVLTAHGPPCSTALARRSPRRSPTPESRSRARVGGERVQHRLQAVALLCERVLTRGGRARTRAARAGPPARARRAAGRACAADLPDRLFELVEAAGALEDAHRIDTVQRPSRRPAARRTSSGTGLHFRQRVMRRRADGATTRARARRRAPRRATSRGGTRARRGHARARRRGRRGCAPGSRRP